MLIGIAFLERRPATSERAASCSRCAVPPRRDADFAHLPRDERRVRADAAARVRMPSAAIMPREDLRGSFRRGRAPPSRPSRGPVLGAVGVEIHLPRRRARSGRKARGSNRPSVFAHSYASRSKIGCEQLFERSAGSALIAVSGSRSAFPSPSRRAIRTAATPVRLPLRVWSMNSFPSSIVNSKSCTSLKCFLQTSCAPFPAP